MELLNHRIVLLQIKFLNQNKLAAIRLKRLKNEENKK